jgi:hypothetical protein
MEPKTLSYCEYSIKEDNDPNLLKAYEEMLEVIKSGKTFSFPRYGDAELLLLNGRGLHHNCDGNAYDPKLKELLKETIDKPHSSDDYWYSFAMNGRGFREYTHINWVDADLLSCANFHGKLKPFIELLNQNDSILVAPKYQHDISVDFSAYFTIQDRNSFEILDEIVFGVEKLIKNYKKPIICMALGLSSEAIIYKLHSLVKGTCWLIDIGAIFDAYLETRIRRSYFKHMTEEIKNLNGL